MSQEASLNPETPIYSLRALSRSAALYSGGDVMVKAISFLLVPLYVNALTPEDFGVVGFVSALVQVLIPLVGLSLINTMPVLYHSVDDVERPRLISSTVNFTFVYGFVVCLLLTVFGEHLPGLASVGIPFYPHVVIGIWSAFAASFFYLPLGIFNMSERPGPYAMYSAGVALIGIGANIVLILVFNMAAVGALLATLLGSAIAMTIGGAIIRREYVPALDRKHLSEVFRLALPALPHLFSSTLARFADRFFLVGLSTLAATGIYQLGLTVASVALVILSGIATALNPFFYRLAYAEDDRLPGAWSRLCSLYFLLVALTGLLLAYPARDVLLMLIPASYHDVVELMPPLVLSQCLTAVYWLFAPGIAYSKRTWAYPIASFPALVVNLVLNSLLIPIIGARGAAWALVAAAFTQLALFASLSQRGFRIPYEGGRLLKLAVVVSVASVVGTAIEPTGSLGTLLTQLAIVFSIIPALTLFGFFTPNEIAATKRAWRRLRDRRRDLSTTSQGTTADAEERGDQS